MTANVNKPGKLFLIPTVLAPDTAQHVLSPQIRETVAQVDYFFVENIRTARRFISELKVGKAIESLHFVELTKDTPLSDMDANLQVVLQGQDAGVLSEAGCPGIADPGAEVVKLAHRKGIQVVPLVGPSSILLALMASGFSGQSFVFHGYLPIDKAERAKAVKQLEKEAQQKNQTQIFMETPFRNNQMLEELLKTCMPDTLLCIASQITAPDQLIVTKRIQDWKKTPPDLHKKPTIFLLYKS
jgi:16S rRNA (cytidine1402-2'-O)-methyltransferase